MAFDELFAIFARLTSANSSSDGDDARVLKFARRYFDAYYAIERQTEGSRFESMRGKHEPLLDAKQNVHREYWCNLSPYYDPNSIGSEADHDWRQVKNTMVLRTGDDDEPRFLLVFSYHLESGGIQVARALAMREVNGHLKIEHEYF